MKRSNGEGTIFKRSDGRWCAAYYDEAPNPKRHYVYGKTQTEVKRKLKEMREKGPIEKTKQGEEQTLAQWILYFLENYKRNELKVTTYSIYLGIYKKHIQNSVPGKTKLNKLKSNQLQKLYNEKVEAGYNAKTVKHISILINSALKKAVQMKLIRENVNEMTSLPKREEYQAEVLTAEDVRRIFSDAKQDELYPIICLTLATGLRKGEVMALKWNDIDFEQKELEVKGNLCRVPQEIDVNGKVKYTYAILSPKTKKSQRRVPLTERALEALKMQQKTQEKAKERYKDIYIDQNLVFASENGDFLNPRLFMDKYHEFLNRYQLPYIRFHDLRHTFATLLLEAGVPPKVMQELLGHTSITTTMDIYAHVTKQGKKNAVEKLDQVFLEN